MREKPTNTPIIHSVYWLWKVTPTCFGITLPSSGSVPSAFWESKMDEKITNFQLLHYTDYIMPLKCRWLLSCISWFQQIHNICAILCHFQTTNIPFSSKMNTKDSVECMLIFIYKISRRHFSDGGNLHSRHHKDIKFHETLYVLKVYEWTWRDRSVGSILVMQILIDAHEYSSNR
jgi:hypothetical protein